MKSLQQRVFTGGLNSDDEDRLIPPGDYRYALNVRNTSTEGNEVGVISNVKGTEELTYELPEGNNKNIGAYWDRENNTNIYFIYNSQGNHQIQRFYPNEKKIELILKETNARNKVLRFTDDLITEIDLVGDYLYWTNKIEEPRKINIKTANRTDKKYKWNCIFDFNVFDYHENPSTINLLLTDLDSINPLLPAIRTSYEFNIDTPVVDNYKDFLEYIVNTLPETFDTNNIIKFKNGATIEEKGNYLEINIKIVGNWELRLRSYTKGTTDINSETKALLINQYYYNYTDETIRAIKAPLKCEPQVELLEDPTKQFNYLKNKVFQFRTRLVYRDEEKTKLSSASVYAYNQFACGQEGGSSGLNTVKVTFTDPRLQDDRTLSLLKYVDLFVKEGQLGKWKKIKSIPIEEIGVAEQSFMFYNDGSYIAISDNENKDLFDALPKLAGTQEFIKDKLFYGDIVEGFDNVNVDASTSVKYSPQVSEAETFSIKGRVVLTNLFAGENSSAQPIWDFGDGPCFGGLSNDANVVDRYVNDVINDYNQSIELGGFVVYLAGTNKYDITKQNVAEFDFGSKGLCKNTSPLKAPIANSSTNVYNGNKSGATTGKISGVGCNNNAEGRKALNLLIRDAGDQIYGEFEIKNVLPGKYVIRLASHLTTQEELDDQSLQYQRTSTNVFYTEPGEDAIQSNDTEIVTEVIDKDVNVGGFFVMDLTQPKNGSGATTITGYVVDKDEEVNSPPTSEELLSDKRIELSEVDIDAGEDFEAVLTLGAYIATGGIAIAISSSSIFNSIKGGGPFYTDHNGYFFSARSFIGGGAGKLISANMKINDTFSGLENLNPSIWHDDDGTVSAFTKANKIKNFHIYIRNGNDDVQRYSRTTINGRVATADGTGISGISIVNTRGDHQITDIDGNYELITYADTKQSNKRTRNSTLYFSQSTPACGVEFDPDEFSYSISISNPTVNPGDYNNLPNDDNDQKQYDAPDIIAVVSNGALANGEKRGSDIQYGIIYYDHANRSGFVNTDNYTLKAHINAYNEKDAETGVIENRGAAIVSWEINHKPPVWATHYQWVKTKDAVTTNYLEWVAKTIDYTDDFDNASNPNDGTQVKISIANIYDETGYNRKNPNSLVNITPGKNWKIRFNADENGNYYDEYLEYDVLTFFEEEFIIVKNNTKINDLKPGMLFEVYDPSPNFDNRLYYEFGECYEIGNAGESDRYHKGNDQIQTTSQPAKGTFKTGSAWFRLRTIPIDGGETTVNIQDASISDFYESKVDHTGRSNAENPDSKELNRETLYRWSAPIIRESAINGLSSFDALASRKLDESYGRLYKLQAVENVLLGWHKQRVVSVYVDEGLLTTLNATDTVTVDDSVVGGVRAMKGVMGTQNRESVYEYQGDVFAWDVNRGVVLRYSSNGLFPISNYKMNSHFLNLSKNILNDNAQDKYVIGAFDPLNLEYVMGFEYNNQIISFSQKDNRWKSFWRYKGENMSNTGLKLISFTDGALHIHEQNELRSNFNGVQSNARIKLVTNDDPSKVKVFTAIHQESNEPWHSPKLFVPPSNLAVNGMESRIPLSRVRPIEGVQYAEILRDINSPGFTNEDEALLNGRPLRGHVCEILLHNDNTELVKLFSVNTVIVQSEYSKKV
jgi:hypothetical protein